MSYGSFIKFSVYIAAVEAGVVRPSDKLEALNYSL